MLQTKKKALVTDISELESVMHEKLEPFLPERQEQEQEYENIRIRQEEIQQKTVSDQMYVISYILYL